MTEPQLQESERVLPVAVGQRIVAHPFDHYGVVGANSTATICEVILDEPLKHTGRVWSVWSEVQREGEYIIEQAQQRVRWAREDVEREAGNAAHAQAALKEARAELRASTRELRELKARYA